MCLPFSPPCPSFPCLFWKKTGKTTKKNKDFLSLPNPKIPGKEAKKGQKKRKSSQGEKTRNSKKNKERKDRARIRQHINKFEPHQFPGPSRNVVYVNCFYLRSGPGKPNQRKVSSWTFRRDIPEQKFNVSFVLVFLGKKNQNSQKWAKCMNFSLWPFLLVWFAGATPDLSPPIFDPFSTPFWTLPTPGSQEPIKRPSFFLGRGCLWSRRNWLQ